MIKKTPKINIDRAAIQAFFRTDNGLLLISMCISLLFWLLVKLSQDYKANREVFITYKLPKTMSFINIPPEKVRVTLEGRGWDLMYDYFGRRITTINFNLGNTLLQNITNNQLKGKMSEALSSTNITISDMSFDYISIELGKSAVKKIPVTLDKELTFAPNHQLQGEIEIIPDSIMISGSLALLQEYTEWSTTLLAIPNIQTTIERSLLLQPNKVPQINISTTAVQVLIPVEQFTQKSIFIPVSVKNAPDSLKVFPNKVKTSFIVGLSRYDTISEKDFLLEVDLKGVSIDQNNNTAPISIAKQPAAVRNIRFSPKAVSFLYVRDTIQ